MLLKYLPLLFMVTAISGCNSIRYIDSEDSHTVLISDNESRKSRPLCKYKETKGMSEVVSIDNNHYEFIFFPGDDQFVRSRKQLVIEFPTQELDQLQVGQEIRSIRQFLVSGHTDCSKVDISLVPSLPH